MFSYQLSELLSFSKLSECGFTAALMSVMELRHLASPAQFSGDFVHTFQRIRAHWGLNFSEQPSG